jgi:hypothetical protein
VHAADGGHTHEADGGHTHEADGGHTHEADGGHTHEADGGHTHEADGGHGQGGGGHGQGGGGHGAGAATPEVLALGEAVFRDYCISCHTIGGGPGRGPDLQNVMHRRPPGWIGRWLRDPVGMVETDPIARALRAE